MKHFANFRSLITIMVIAVTACSDPDIITPTSGTSSTATQEFHAVVTSWNRSQTRDFVSTVVPQSNLDLSKASVYMLRAGNRVLLTGLAPVGLGDGTISATVQTGAVIISFRGNTQSSPPPVFVDILIVTPVHY